MARGLAICLSVALLAVCGVSATSRSELILPQSAAGSLVHEVVDALKGWAGNAQAEGALLDNKVSSRPSDNFYILVKYVVRPAEQREFAKTGLDTREDVKEQKGNVRYTLSKTLTDNLILYSYQEWESKQDFYEHIKSKAVEPLAEYIKENDIPLFLTSLIPIEGEEDHHHHHGHGKHHHDNSADDSFMASMQELVGETAAPQSFMAALESGSKPEPRELGNVIILTKFLVKPSETRDFVKAFLKVREEVREEKGNLIYGLSKTLTDNLTFYAYAEWEDKAAFKEHIKSSYIKKFVKFIEEGNIPILITSLIPIEDLDRF